MPKCEPRREVVASACWVGHTCLAQTCTAKCKLGGCWDCSAACLEMLLPFRAMPEVVRVTVAFGVFPLRRPDASEYPSSRGSVIRVGKGKAHRVITEASGQADLSSWSSPLHPGWGEFQHGEEHCAEQDGHLSRWANSSMTNHETLLRQGPSSALRSWSLSGSGVGKLGKLLTVLI